MSKLRVCIENNSSAYAQMFVDNGWEVVNSIEDADLLQLEGGADVSPELYGEAPHPRTWASENADWHTALLYVVAIELGIPIAGICRGSQFLCVMGGGKLWQDVDGHATGAGHNLLDIESGDVIEGVSSTHHQQHRPASNAITIAVASPQLTTCKESMVNGERGYQSAEKEDVEAFYYPHINALGYQPHPEFFNNTHPCQKYYFNLIERYIGLRCTSEE